MKTRFDNMTNRHSLRATAVAALAVLMVGGAALAAPGGPVDPTDPIDPINPGQIHPVAAAYDIVRQRVPTLKEFRLVKLDTRTIARRAAESKPVRLPFAVHGATRMLNPVANTVDVTLNLSQTPLIAAGTQGLLIYDIGLPNAGGNDRADQQVEVVDLPESHSYQGPIVDQVQGRGGYIIRPNMVMGATFAPYPPMGDSGLSVIEPVGRLLKKNGATQQEIQTVSQRFNHVVYNSAAVQGDILIDIEDSIRDVAKPHHRSGATRARVNQDISIYMMGDVDYVADYANTGAAFDDQTWTLFGVELITQLSEPGPFGNDEFDIDIDVVGQALWVIGGPSSTDPALLLGEGYNQFPWNIVSTPVNDIGLVHMFTGKNLDGNVIGKAWKIGGFDDACGAAYATDPACKQSVAQPQFTGTNWLLEVILMAHEIGHNMDAVHSDCETNYCAGTTCGRTVMCSGLGSDQVFFFSAPNATAIADKVDAECASDDC